MKLTLNRNSWHRRLQRYVLLIGTDQREDFPNLCPYFWLTIFCMLVVPFVWGFRVTRKPIGGFFLLLGRAVVGFFEGLAWVVEWVVFPINEYVCKPLDDYYVETYIKKLTPEELVKLFDNKNGKKSYEKVFKRWIEAVWIEEKEKENSIFHASNYYDQIQHWRQDIYDQKVALKREKQAAEQAACEARLKVEAARKKRLMQIARITQKAAPFILAAVLIPLVGGLGWSLWKLGVLISRIVIPWAKVGIVALWGLGLGVGGLLGFILLVFLFQLFSKLFGKCWMFCSPVMLAPFRLVRRPLGFCFRPFGWIGIGLKAFGIGFADGVILLCQYLKAAKEDYCPEIDWKE